MKNVSKYFGFPYFLFLLLIVSVPLVFTTYFENPVDLVKSGTVKIIGSLLIIFTLLILYGLINFGENSGITFRFNKSIDIPMTALIASALLSAIFSLNPLVSFYGQYSRQVGLIIYIHLAALYFLSRFFLDDKSRILKLIWAAELTAVIVSVYSMLQFLGYDPTGSQPSYIQRPISTFGNAVFLGGFLAAVLPFTLMNVSQKPPLLRIVFIVIILGGILISRTRAAYLALGAELIVLPALYLYLKRKQSQNFRREIYFLIAIVFGLAVTIILVSVIYPGNVFTQRFLSIIQGNNPRIILWQDSFGIFKKYPLTGAGIAMFPSAFEEFYSQKLRIADPGGYFDHPHNNFFYYLFSMGILGFLSYTVLIIQGMRIAFKKIFLGSEDMSLFIALFVFLTGYTVYGLTNFDDISILLYFFIFTAVLSKISIDESNSLPLKLKNKKALNTVIAVAIILGILNIYDSVNELRADRYFKAGNVLSRENKFAESVHNMNNAIILNNYCSSYKIALADNVYRYCSAKENLSDESKAYLLNQVIEETNKGRKNHFIQNECDELLSLAYYELGRESEAEELKNKAIARDSININYRLNLASYYMKAGRNDDVIKQFDVIFKYRPKSVEALITAAFFNFKINNKEGVKKSCEMILELEPGNAIALKLMEEARK